VGKPKPKYIKNNMRINCISFQEKYLHDIYLGIKTLIILVQ